MEMTIALVRLSNVLRGLGNVRKMVVSRDIFLVQGRLTSWIHSDRETAYLSTTNCENDRLHQIDVFPVDSHFIIM